MKTGFSKHVRFFPILCWAALASHVASAQTPRGLNIELYAGLSITGTVGTVYSVSGLSGRVGELEQGSR